MATKKEIGKELDDLDVKFDPNDLKADLEDQLSEAQAKADGPKIELDAAEFMKMQEQMKQLLDMVESSKDALSASDKQREEMGRIIEAQQAFRPESMVTGSGERTLEGEWGPYDVYMYVPTRYGEYACPLEKVLYFIEVQKLNRETMMLEWVPIPRYRDATADELKKAKSPAMAPLRPDRVKPIRSFEEAMNAWSKLQNSADQALTHVPVKPPASETS